MYTTQNPLFLQAMDFTFNIGWIVFLIVGAVIAGLFTWIFLKNDFKKKYGSYKELRDKLIEEAREESKTLKKEAILEAKEQEIKLRNDFERDSK